MKSVDHSKEPESVRDYPRPPRVEATAKHIRVIFNGQLVAETRHAYRVLETSHPPTYYIPKEDVRREFLFLNIQSTMCEFKGVARYWTLRVGERVSESAAWSYAEPTRGYETIRDCFCFYASRVDACFVDDERAVPEGGDFYGGWITSELTGSIKCS